MAISAVAGAFGANKAAKSQKNAIGEAMAVLQQYAGENTGLQKSLYDEMLARNNEARTQTYQNAGAAADHLIAGNTAAQNHLLATSRAATDYLNTGYDQARGDLQPYADTGKSALERLYSTYITGETPYQVSDPGYEWRLKQGQQAVERSAAARGGLYSGATGKALTDYAQGAASQEFQAGYNRLAPLAQMGVNVAGTMANLDSNRGTALANLNTSLGTKLADINVNQGSKLADLTTWSGGQNNALSTNMNALTDSYAGRRSSILQNLANGLAGGHTQYGAASAAGTMGVANSIGGLGQSIMNAAGFLSGTNMFGGGGYGGTGSGQMIVGGNGRLGGGV